MNINQTICLLSLMLLNSAAWAYGSSSSAKACEKPQFTEFSPSANSDVAPRAAFSFTASSVTNPKTLSVIIKGKTIDLSITPKNTGYLVKGNLPAEVKGTAARINISAESPSRCKGNDGWLINITE